MQPAAALLYEMSEQLGNVVPTIAQRRQHDRKHTKTIKQIEPEAAVGNFPLQIAVGGRDHPDVDTPRDIVAHPLELAFLQHAQQLHLEIERNLSDLVEKQRTAVGELKAADAVADGAGERSTHVTEELALEQLARNRSTVDLDQRP